MDVAIAGDSEPVATMDRPWFTEAVAADTAEALLTRYVPGSSAVLERISPVMRVLEAAAANDPEVSTLWPQDEDMRYVVQRAAAEALVTKPGARQGLTAQEAADILYAILSPELYLLLVRNRSWSHDSWVRWATGTLRAQLCSAPQPG